jgi:DNA helicase MCM8
MYLCYIDANAVDNNKQVDTGKLDLMQFSLKEMYGIQAIASHKNPFALIVKSLCPSIFGHEIVKGTHLLNL